MLSRGLLSMHARFQRSLKSFTQLHSFERRRFRFNYQFVPFSTTQLTGARWNYTRGYVWVLQTCGRIFYLFSWCSEVEVLNRHQVVHKLHSFFSYFAFVFWVYKVYATNTSDLKWATYPAYPPVKSQTHRDLWQFLIDLIQAEFNTVVSIWPTLAN